MDVPDGGYTSKPTLHRKSSFSILSKCILRFLRINSLCPGNKKRVKNAGIPFPGSQRVGKYSEMLP